MPSATKPAETTSEIPCCSIKVLPKKEWIPAAATAVNQNAANAPMLQMLQDVVLPPEHAALLTSKYWGAGGVNLTVSFMDSPAADLRTRILSHMNARAVYANVQFHEVGSGGQVRIALTPGKGHWSYLGTDVLHISADLPTMNLDSFSMQTQDSEFYRVVRHETGHTLGFPHEHMLNDIVNRIDREKAIAFFMANQGWSRDEVIAQVLTPLDNSALIRTASADTSSIMCYWLPASIMKDNIAVTGGTDIDNTDGSFAASVYPKFPSWQLLDNNHDTISTAAADGNLYQLHKTGKIWKYTGTPLTGWQMLDNNPASVKIIATGGSLYQLHNTGKIWKYTGVPLTGWQMLDNNAATVDIVASLGDLYQLHNTGKIWKYTGTPLTGWQELDNNGDTKKIAASGGNLYQLHKTGKIWKYTGVPHTGWQMLDNNGATIDIVPGGNDLYQLHDTGKIWKYTGTPLTGWQMLDNNPAAKEIAVGAGGILYQLHKTGAIWKYIGPPLTGWKQLDSNAASTYIVAANSLYQLHNTGLIWKYTG
jgi:hypothetical protein